MSSESEMISIASVGNTPNLVYLDVAGRLHSLYQMLINHPPEGFAVSTGNSRIDQVSRQLAGNSNLFRFVQGPIAGVMPTNLLKAYLEKLKHPPEGTVLTFSNGHLVFRPEPWVVDMEFVTQLAGYNYLHFLRFRRVIERRLASSYCKRIMSWTAAGVLTILENLDSQSWHDKVEEVPLAAPAQREFVKGNESDRVKLLFVGSVNIPGQFELKGGMEIVAMYEKLSQRYDDIELVMRCDISTHWRKRVDRLPNVTILEQPVPWRILDREFRTADLFLFPSYHTPGLVFLDAMSYEVPIITTDVWANSEMVLDGVTGFVIPASRRIPHMGVGIPGWGDPKFVQSLTEADLTVVEALMEKTCTFIDNASLRRQMGKAGRREVEVGRFSLRQRNDLLREIFEEACHR